MQFCPYCNSTNRTGAQFCNTCGRSLPGPSLICSRCRALLAEVDKFCHNCGARLSEAGRQFHAVADSPGDADARPVDPEVLGLGSGTFVDAAEPAADEPPATATPSIPHRLEGSWQFIDSWVAKQTQPSERNGAREEHIADTGAAVGSSEVESPVRQSPSGELEEQVEAVITEPFQASAGHAIDRAAYARRQISTNQAMGIVAVLIAIASIILWLGRDKS